MKHSIWHTPLSRRALLRLAIAGPVAGFLSACSAPAATEKAVDQVEKLLDPSGTGSTLSLAPTPTPEPFIVPEGEQRVSLMPGTIFETTLYVFGSGHPGQVMMVLGGVHGNEPGGWLAAEQLLETMRPVKGALLIVPKAHQQATAEFVRTRDEWGDLNRLYPGSAEVELPMAQMAWQITEALRQYRVTLVLDMHESWAFFNGRPQNGTAFLGQTVSTSSNDRAKSIAREAVAAVNARILHPWEQLFDRNDPNNPRAGDGSPPTAGGGSRNFGGGIPNAGQSVPGGTSSLGLARHVSNLSTMLVEMGQQQDLERRIALHVDFAAEVATRLGVIEGRT